MAHRSFGMKSVVRIAAILSFIFFLIPGLWLAFGEGPEHEAGVVVVGLVLLGIAFFVGPMLWLTGER